MTTRAVVAVLLALAGIVAGRAWLSRTTPADAARPDVATAAASGFLVQPTGPEARAFTERVIPVFRRAHPEQRIEIAGELQLRSEDGTTLNLGNLWHRCATLPESADAEIERWARIGVKQKQPAAPRLEDLRVTLFQTASLPPHTVIARPWLGELSETLVLDLPETIASLSREKAPTLGSEADLYRRALANLDAAVGAPFDSQPMSHLTPNLRVSYLPNWSAARLLLPDRWKGIAAAAHQTLLAAAPARDVLIWAVDPNAKETRAFRFVAQQLYGHEPHPISQSIFRWKAGAWVLVDANETPIDR